MGLAGRATPPARGARTSRGHGGTGSGRSASCGVSVFAGHPAVTTRTRARASRMCHSIRPGRTGRRRPRSCLAGGLQGFSDQRTDGNDACQPPSATAARVDHQRHVETCGDSIRAHVLARSVARPSARSGRPRRRSARAGGGRVGGLVRWGQCAATRRRALDAVHRGD